MPVIINDFEVVAEAPQAARGTTAGAAPAGGAPSQAPVASAPNPLDILRIEEHQLLRRMRLWAH
jgi:hypothetical protein